MRLQLSTNQRAGDRLLTVRELSKQYDGRMLWKDVKLDVGRGERIGIIGPNGSGKTTLLRVLLGQEPLDAGEVRWGANLSIGYYDQRLDAFDPENTVLEELAEGRENRKEKELRDTLGALRFSGDSVEKTMDMLSGGERARVALAGLLIDRPNVLILDEPTNHLDVNSCEALENALSGFEGTILCVSHDRYFLERMAKRMWVIEPPALIDFDGGFDEWIRKKKSPATAPAQAKAASKSQSKSPPKKEPKPPAKKENPYARPFGRLSLIELEKTIAQTERELAQAQSRFAGSIGRDAKQVQQEYDALTEKLEGLEAEYFARGE